MLEPDALKAVYALPDRLNPRVRVNFVSSVDGAATLDGRSGGLGNADDQQIMQLLRAEADVLLVGAGTVRAEGYGGVGLPLAIVSSSLDLDPGHPVFAGDAPRFVVTHADAPPARIAELSEVAEVLVCGRHGVDLRAAIVALAERELTQVLCEGGPHLFGSLVQEDLVDELCLSLSSVIAGGTAGRIVRGAPEQLRRMRLLNALPTDDMVFLRYGRAAS